MQTGFSETFIGWKFEKTTYVPLWDRMEGAWLWTTKYIYKEKPQCLSPRRNGTLPHPLSPASVPLPPGTKGGRTHLPTGEGLGESQFRRLEKKLSTLPTLCYGLRLTRPAKEENPR